MKQSEAIQLSLAAKYGAMEEAIIVAFDVWLEYKHEHQFRHIWPVHHIKYVPIQQ